MAAEGDTAGCSRDGREELPRAQLSREGKEEARRHHCGDAGRQGLRSTTQSLPPADRVALGLGPCNRGRTSSRTVTCLRGHLPFVFVGGLT